MKDIYSFPAIITVDNDGVAIEFPDFPGCCPCASDINEAFTNAREALQLHIYCMEEDEEEIPEPTDVMDIKFEKGQVIAMIEAWMPPFREKMLNKATNKTVTIPRWLDILAKKEKVNYSHLLQDALKQYLGITSPESLQAYAVHEQRAEYSVKRKK